MTRWHFHSGCNRSIRLATAAYCGAESSSVTVDPASTKCDRREPRPAGRTPGRGLVTSRTKTLPPQLDRTRLVEGVRWRVVSATCASRTFSITRNFDLNNHPVVRDADADRCLAIVVSKQCQRLGHHRAPSTGQSTPPAVTPSGHRRAGRSRLRHRVWATQHPRARRPPSQGTPPAG